MQYGQDGAAAARIEEFGAMPGGGGGAGFGFAIADDAGDQEIGIVERGTEGSGKGVAEFAALVNGAGDAGIKMAGKALGPGKTAHELMEAVSVQGEFGIKLL